MRAVINGLLYDSSKATLVKSRDCGNAGDFYHLSEDLYMTSSGRFFIFFQGGALSRYGHVNDQGERSGSVGMRTLSKEEALVWCETYDVEVDTILRFFKTEDA